MFGKRDKNKNQWTISGSFLENEDVLYQCFIEALFKSEFIKKINILKKVGAKKLPIMINNRSFHADIKENTDRKIVLEITREKIGKQLYYFEIFFLKNKSVLTISTKVVFENEYQNDKYNYLKVKNAFVPFAKKLIDITRDVFVSHGYKGNF